MALHENVKMCHMHVQRIMSCEQTIPLPSTRSVMLYQTRECWENNLFWAEKLTKFHSKLPCNKDNHVPVHLYARFDLSSHLPKSLILQKRSMLYRSCLSADWTIRANSLGLANSAHKRHLPWYIWQSKKISNDQELIQSDPTTCPQNQQENN